MRIKYPSCINLITADPIDPSRYEIYWEGGWHDQQKISLKI